MKYFYLRGRITDEMLLEFIRFNNENPTDEITIVLDSGGGSNYIAMAILDIINNRPNVTLLLFQGLSMAMWLFCRAKCKKKLANGAFLMWHYTAVSIDVKPDGKPYFNGDENMVKIMRQSFLPWGDAFAKTWLNEKEFKKYKRHNDVYLSYERVKELFPEAEVID